MEWSELIPKSAADLANQLVKRVNDENANILPCAINIFKALRVTKPENVKVCIVGQDPYPTAGVANGLAFSVNPDKSIPPSLRNIFAELRNDIGCGQPLSGDLTPWAERGVLLLNTTLTVYEGKPNSHASWGWNRFTIEILKAATRLPQPIVFMLWGASAQKMLNDLISCACVYRDNKVAIEKLIKKAYILSSHPSPLGVNRSCGKSPPFSGSAPFSTANSLLEEMGGEPIDWNLS